MSKVTHKHFQLLNCGNYKRYTGSFRLEPEAEWIESGRALVAVLAHSPFTGLTASGKVTDVVEALGPVTFGVNAVVRGFDWTGNGPHNDIGFRCSWAAKMALGWNSVAGRDLDRAIPGDTRQ